MIDKKQLILDKKNLLDKLYYEIGKQEIDFELSYLQKLSGDETKSTKWKKFSEVCFDIDKNKKLFENLNCRQILSNEIVIDLDNEKAINNFQNIVERLRKEFFYFHAYQTGSKGYHIHLFFDEDIEEETKEKMIILFDGDSMKKSKRNLIALENWFHWKTGKLKTLVDKQEGINKKQELIDFIDKHLEELEDKKVSDEDKKLIEDILKDPKLFEKITVDEFDKKIVGEIETRKVIFLCASGGRLVENCQIASYNLLINDEAGAGKDYITREILKILPKEYFIWKTRISPTVFTYWHNSLTEPEWTWDGKVFYPEDISEAVLNSDVFKVMCSGGSSATITIKQEAIDIEIIGKPVMITTTASAVPNPELTRRFVILNLDSSQDQTKAIMKRHSEFKKKGIVPTYDLRYTKAMNLLKRVKVIVPYADLIDEHFPSKNIIMRTHYPRFLDFICASAAFYQYQRKKNEEGFILAEKQDYDIARDCYLKLCSNKYMISLTLNQKKILEIFENNLDLKGSASQLHSDNMNFLSLKALMTNLGILVKYGFLSTSTEKDAWNRDLEVYSLSKSYNPSEKLIIPTFDEIQKEENTYNTYNTSEDFNTSNTSSTYNSSEKEGVLRVLRINHENDISNSNQSDERGCDG